MAAGISLALRVEVLAIGPLRHAVRARSAVSAAAALRKWVVNGVELGGAACAAPRRLRSGAARKWAWLLGRDSR